jgi:hypothetical protein
VQKGSFYFTFVLSDAQTPGTNPIHIARGHILLIIVLQDINHDTDINIYIHRCMYRESFLQTYE